MPDGLPSDEFQQLGWLCSLLQHRGARSQRRALPLTWPSAGATRQPAAACVHCTQLQLPRAALAAAATQDSTLPSPHGS